MTAMVEEMDHRSSQGSSYVPLEKQVIAEVK